ncbi:MAG: response regulator [Gammaproteobacteria bacterium]|nr:response regulator [Gammaproteobacteria bacterium]
MNSRVILCVDDEEIILNALESQFNKAFGDVYMIELAQSAEDGLEILDELSVEGVEILVIVSDWLMPKMKGDEFLIQAHKKFPKIIKVMLTGQVDQEAVERARNYANLHTCIRKPWDVEELIETINTGVEKYG